MSANNNQDNNDNNKGNNMYNDHNELPATDKVANDTINAQAAHIVELESELAKTVLPAAADDWSDMAQLVRDLEDRIDSDAAEITKLTSRLELETRAVEEYRSDVRSNVARIEGVLHEHARDCDDMDLIDGLIDQINQATRNGFPGLNNCTREYEITVTLVATVDAASEEDAQDKFDDGEYDHLFDVSGHYYEVHIEEGC